MLVSVSALRLGVVIVQALETSSSPAPLKAILGILQFVLILGAPMAAGVWWGRGRPLAGGR
jgi:hypothetical protein